MKSEIEFLQDIKFNLHTAEYGEGLSFNIHRIERMVNERLDQLAQKKENNRKVACVHDWFGINQLMSQCRNCGVIVQDN